MKKALQDDCYEDFKNTEDFKNWRKVVMNYYYREKKIDESGFRRGTAIRMALTDFKLTYSRILEWEAEDDRHDEENRGESSSRRKVGESHQGEPT